VALSASCPAFATDYFVVVPVPNRVTPTANITVAMRADTLPAAMGRAALRWV
jgi:hypothetical protein